MHCPHARFIHLSACPPAIQPSFRFPHLHFRRLPLFFEPTGESSKSLPPSHTQRTTLHGTPCAFALNAIRRALDPPHRLLHTLPYFTPHDFSPLHTSHTPQQDRLWSPCLGLAVASLIITLDMAEQVTRLSGSPLQFQHKPGIRASSLERSRVRACSWNNCKCTSPRNSSFRIDHENSCLLFSTASVLERYLFVPRTSPLE